MSRGCHYSPLTCSPIQRGRRTIRVHAISLQEAAQQIDRLLDAAARSQQDAEAPVTALVQTLKAEGVLRAFGTAQQVPKRIYTLDELRLNKIEPESLLSPKDDSLNFVRNVAQVPGRTDVFIYKVG